MLIVKREPTETTIDRDDKGYYVRGRLMSTRVNDRYWKIRKETFLNKQKLDSVILGKPFAIIPGLIHAKGNNGGGHFYSNLEGKARYDELMKGYKDNSHGTISETYGPFEYPEDEGEYYYDYRIDLANDRAASALVEHGAKTLIPYSTSIHVWPLAFGETDDDITDYDVFGTALVIKGAWDDTVLHKMCEGGAGFCKLELQDKAASSVFQTCHCDKCEESLARFVSSFIDKAASVFLDNNKMATDPAKLGGLDQGQTLDPTKGANNVNLNQEDPNIVKLSKEEHAQLLKLAQENKEKSESQAKSDARIAELELESKTNAIDRMFPSALITDSNVLTLLRDTYSKKSVAEVKGLETFLNDLGKNYLPFVLESAKKQWEAENKAKNTTESNTADNKDNKDAKGKDKSASSSTELASEPKSTDEEITDKPASTAQKSNPIAEARALLIGGKY